MEGKKKFQTMKEIHKTIENQKSFSDIKKDLKELLPLLNITYNMVVMKSMLELPKEMF